MRIAGLNTRPTKTDTIGGFDIFTQVLTQPEDPMPSEVPQIDNIDILSEEKVRGSMQFKRYFGQTYDVQDLRWSQELLEQSCKDDLRTKMMERLRYSPDEEQGGALFYYIMIQLIQTDTEQAVCVLTDKLERLTVKKLTAENIFTAVILI